MHVHDKNVQTLQKVEKFKLLKKNPVLKHLLIILSDLI